MFDIPTAEELSATYRDDIATELNDALWFLGTNDPTELENIQLCLQEALRLVVKLRKGEAR